MSPATVTVATRTAQDVRAGLAYLTDTLVPPVIYYDQPGPPRRVGNYGLFPTTVHDMRPLADRLDLDREGFRLIHRPSAVRDFEDEDELRSVYYPEVEDAVKAATGATRAIVFDHTIRIEGNLDRQDTVHRAPVRLVHNDYTHESGPRRVRDLLPVREAEAWLDGRVIEVNLWRPIRGPVRQVPLAVADARSIRPEHLVTVNLVYPARTGEIYHVVHDPRHRWYWAPEMTTDEAILIKGYDSFEDGRARFTPHTAFDLPDTPDNAPPRESIEVRLLATFAG